MNTAPDEPSPDFLPTASIERLRLRGELLARTRTFFTARGFLEVDTPLVSRDTVIDRHIDPLAVTLPPDARRPEVGPTCYLQSSPEFHMKRLLAAGSGPIFQITRAFRGGERGRLHNPEFTIVEWYRPGDGMDVGMTLLSELAEILLTRGPAQRLSYREAFQRHAAIDPCRADLDQLVAAARAAGIEPPAGHAANDRDAWLDLLLIERVESHLGRQCPTILFDYPPSQAALARVRPGDPPLAERFELYDRGIELANGFCELLDGAELADRAAEANRQRVAEGKPPLPEKNRLLEAMRHGLPPCTGCALGFDRVVMLAAGAASLDEVLPFPIERA